MNNQVVTSIEGDGEVTKWEVVKSLQNKITTARAKQAYCENKQLNGMPYMGDLEADLAYNKAEADTAEKILNKILSEEAVKE